MSVKDESRVKVEVELSGEDLGCFMGHADVMPFLKGVVGAQSSYELYSELFVYVMEHMIDTIKDDRADPDVKLEIDDLITRWVTEFRKSLHGK